MVRSIALLGVALLATTTIAEQPGLYEMRVYYPQPGKFEAMMSRFRDHTCALFEKHGMQNIGYFVPTKDPQSKLVYFLGFPNAAAREASWKAFIDDPAWQTAYKASEKDGPLVAKVESFLMQPTDFSPPFEPTASGGSAKVYELRDYTASKGNLAALQSRFRDHTCELFKKHGMTNVLYFTRIEGQPDADTKLVYLLAHDSEDAAKASFDAFRQDPKWVAAREASEKAAGGSLTAAENGVLSEFFTAADFSPLK
jgi:hypothetical protein